MSLATLEGGPEEGPAARLTDLEIVETTLETKDGMKLHIGEKLSMLSNIGQRQIFEQVISNKFVRIFTNKPSICLHAEAKLPSLKE